MELRKDEAINAIILLKNDENMQKVNGYIEKIKEMSETEWKEFLNKSSIHTIEHLYKRVEELLKKEDMIVLNDLIKYGYINSTIHIHTVIDDAHNMLSRKGLQEAKQKLIDALEKIQIILQEDPKMKNINKIYAVSPILRRPIIDIFEDLDFDIKVLNANQAKEDEELKAFYERFQKKSKKQIKKLGRACISKEKLLSKQWNQLKDTQKNEIDLEEGKDI